MKKIMSLFIVVLTIQVQSLFAQRGIPHLQKVGDQYQLVVDGAPFLMLAGEMGGMGTRWSYYCTNRRKGVLLCWIWSFAENEKPEKNARIGILKTDRSTFKDGKWTIYEHLNGDQTHQGRYICSFVDDVSIHRFTLYEYE